MIDWCNQNQGYIMVLLTAVYVVATIIICVFNYRSVKATKEQIKETKRQFEEENRAYITYEFLYEKRSFYGIRFTNHGKRVANHVKIQLKQEFIDNIIETSYSDLLNNQKDRQFILGIGQSYDIYFGSNDFRQNPNKVPLEGQLFYKDDKNSYSEPFFIDIGHYATMFSVNSETEDLIDAIKNQTKGLKQINQELNQIALNISKENDAE